MKRIIIFAVVSLLFFSCKSQEIFLFDNIPPEDQAKIKFGYGVNLTALNGKKIKIKNYSTIVVPSGGYKLVLNLFEDKHEPGQADFDRYFYDSYTLDYYFEPEKSYQLYFFIEENYFLLIFKEDTWILTIKNVTDNTTEKIIVQTTTDIVPPTLDFKL
jgi:hypothetical protein